MLMWLFERHILLLMFTLISHCLLISSLSSPLNVSKHANKFCISFLTSFSSHVDVALQETHPPAHFTLISHCILPSSLSIPVNVSKDANKIFISFFTSFSSHVDVPLRETHPPTHFHSNKLLSFASPF